MNGCIECYIMSWVGCIVELLCFQAIKYILFNELDKYVSMQSLKICHL